MNDNGKFGAGKRDPAKQVQARPLPKRIYTSASVSPDAPWQILLDGRAVKTPRKLALVLPTRALAEAIAAEWSAQAERIDPATMPLTRLANTAVDAVAGQEAAVADDIVKYAGSDLTCYRADAPEELVALQAEAWDPVLDWAAGTLGARLIRTTGLMPVSQSQPALAAIAAAVQPLDAFRLSALHVMTTLTGSAVLALAHLGGRLSAAEAWAAAHVDEDWQIAQWGEDAEAAERRARRWREMETASRLVTLLG